MKFIKIHSSIIFSFIKNITLCFSTGEKHLEKEEMKEKKTLYLVL